MYEKTAATTVLICWHCVVVLTAVPLTVVAAVVVAVVRIIG